MASSSSIVTEENSYHGFTAEAVLQAEVETVEYQSFIWLSQDGTGGHFVLDLGCKQSFTEILLRNCHNYIYQDRSTETLRFDSLFHSGLTDTIYIVRVSVSDDPASDQWDIVLSETLEDSRTQTDPLPIQQLELDVPVVEKQFVKVEVVTYYGSSGGLEYFDIVRSAPRLLESVKRECTQKAGDCQPLAQFCSSRKCISDTVSWADSSLPGLVQRGCSHSAGQDYFADLTEQKCVSKKAAGGQSQVCTVNSTVQ